MNRRKARELAFTLLYERAFKTDTPPDELYRTAITEREEEDDLFVRNLFFGVCENYPEITAKINECAIGWQSERISKIPLAIMRIAVFEMLYGGEVPFNIAINEALEIAKKYGEDNAPAFINGILNAIAEKEGLKKTDGKEE